MNEEYANKAGKFDLGEVVHHQRYNYRGVVYDVDPQFMLPEEWYEKVAESKPAKDQPWYRVLIDGQDQEAYVAEQNLIRVENPEMEPIEHPALDEMFEGFADGRYRPRHVMN